MVFGITGNTQKEHIWPPLRHAVRLLKARDTQFVLAPEIAAGLTDAGASLPSEVAGGDAQYFDTADVVLSFGGDGTLLNTVHEIGDAGVPILGVNLGRLGFLAVVDDAGIEEAIDAVLSGDYDIDDRRMLHVRATGSDIDSEQWALNEVVLTRGEIAGLVTFEVYVNDAFLNSYWADGLIIATPTGSTAYSLSAGGPIITPGSQALTITPLAPHSLTERPIVIPLSSRLEIRVRDTASYVFATDGRSTVVSDNDTRLLISAADRTVKLVSLPEQHYFETLRSKLMWGSRRKA